MGRYKCVGFAVYAVKITVGNGSTWWTKIGAGALYDGTQLSCLASFRGG